MLRLRIHNNHHYGGCNQSAIEEIGKIIKIFEETGSVIDAVRPVRILSERTTKNIDLV